jgi:hypothetical protein
MNESQLYSPREAKDRVIKACQGKGITGGSGGFIYSLFHDISDFGKKHGSKRSRLNKGDKITSRQITFVSEYINECYRIVPKKTIAQWAKEKNVSYPNSYVTQAVIEALKVAPKITPQSNAITREEMVALLESSNRKLKGEIKSELIAEMPNRASSDFLLVNGPTQTRDTDPRITEMHRRVERFIHEEEASAKRVWTHCKNAFEERNGIKVCLVPGQSLPQWLRHEEYLDIFISQLQGILDDLHNSLDKQEHRK